MPDSKFKVHTTGYTGKNVEDLPELLDAVLFDIRFSPNSRVAKWSKDNLQALLKEKYHHVQPFGNRTFRENKITIHNLELGLKILKNQPSNVLLMCACEDLKTCHRFVLTHELRKRGYDVQEVEEWRTVAPTLFFNGGLLIS